MSEQPTEISRSRSGDRHGDLDAVEQIQQALRGLQYGEVTVTIQDGVPIQVERTERTRIRGGSRRR